MLRKKQDPVLGSNKKNIIIVVFFYIKKLDSVSFRKKHNYYVFFVKSDICAKKKTGSGFRVK